MPRGRPKGSTQKKPSQKKEETPKRKPGAPTKYKPEYCATVVDVMKDGSSLIAVAAKIGVSRKILTDWQHRHPEFRVACDAGKALSQKWWEQLATSVATGECMEHPVYHRSNANMIQFLMSRRFSDYYAKNRQIIQDEPQAAVKDKIAEMSREERLEAIKRYKLIIETLESEDD